MRRIAIGLALLTLGACTTINSTQADKRWAALEGSEVFVTEGYTPTVHGNAQCPELHKGGGPYKKYRYKDGRFVDEQGLFAGSQRERLPLCDRCVK